MRALLVHHQHTATHLRHDVGVVQLEHRPLAHLLLDRARGHDRGRHHRLGHLVHMRHHTHVQQLLPAFGTWARRRGEGTQVARTPIRHPPFIFGERRDHGRFRFEVKAGHDVEPAQCATHSRVYDGVHHAIIAELDLGLGRVYVDVDLRGIQFDEEEPRRKVIARDQFVVRLADGVLQVAAADEAAVDEEVLFATRSFRELRLAHEACNRDQLGALVHRHQALIVLATE